MKFRDYTKYEVFEDGRIWSYWTNKFLKPQTTKDGYQQVNLYDYEGKMKHYLVHRVVWEAVTGSPIPEGYEIQVRPRSGLALKKGVELSNSPGTIDADYRSEIGVILKNGGLDTIWIEDGERICQFVLNKVERIDWNIVESLDKTERNGGFGSTGTH